MNPTVALTTFVAILPAELPDKTFVASLVLATRFRPAPVWCGVAAAFAVQSAVAVTVGGLVSALPRGPVLAVAAALFALGAVLLLRAGEAPEIDEGDGAAGVIEASSLRIALASFGVLFAAEWGDLSQLLTAGLTVRYDDPVAVFLGSWTALALIGLLAVVGGRALIRVVPLQIVRRVAGAIFAVLAILTGIEAVAAL